jgi:hypothetical protein
LGMPFDELPFRIGVRGDGAAIDHQTDVIDRTEAAIPWIQARSVTVGAHRRNTIRSAALERPAAVRRCLGIE